MNNENETIDTSLNSAEPEAAAESRVDASAAEAAPAGFRSAPGKAESKHSNAGAKVIALVLICSLLSGLIGSGITALISSSGKAEEIPVEDRTAAEEVLMYRSTRNAAVELKPVSSDELLSDAEIYALNVNSTVGITTSITSTNYWGFTSKSAASGSGFILSADGYILTNYHVVESSTSITVTCYDGTAYDAALIGYDESNDIAVLKVDAQDLTPVVLGSSDSLNVGDHVVAIGNPLGELTFSMTQGAVSALDRAVTLSSGSTMNLIQTDCAINSGNSGGALFNAYGEVVGITNAKYSSSGSDSASIDNIGFAIPIDHILPIVNSIIEKGYISKPYIGVSVLSVSEDTQTYGIPAGASIQAITDGAPAQQAGLLLYDVITAVNGQEISSSSDLVTIISEAQPGDELLFTVYRSGETLELTVVVGEKIESALASEESSASDSVSASENGYGYGYSGGFGYGNGNGGFGYGFGGGSN